MSLRQKQVQLLPHKPSPLSQAIKRGLFARRRAPFHHVIKTRIWYVKRKRRGSLCCEKKEEERRRSSTLSSTVHYARTDSFIHRRFLYQQKWEKIIIIIIMRAAEKNRRPRCLSSFRGRASARCFFFRDRKERIIRGCVSHTRTALLPLSFLGPLTRELLLSGRVIILPLLSRWNLLRAYRGKKSARVRDASFVEMRVDFCEWYSGRICERTRVCSDML